MKRYEINAGQRNGLLDIRQQRVQSSLRAALRSLRSVLGVDSVWRVSCPDGIYCYRSRADRDADADGSSAAAVITVE